MKKSLAAIAASIPLVLAAPVLAQGIGHSLFMRGSIIGADSQGTIVCIGKADGAKVGQTLNVYRTTYRPGPAKGNGPTLTRTLIGHVRIDHVFDEHFAHVSRIDGQPARNDIVELQQG